MSLGLTVDPVGRKLVPAVGLTWTAALSCRDLENSVEG